MSGKSFYIRNRGQVTGPFDQQQLQFLRDRGQLARFHELSEDKRNWVRAGSISELFPVTPPVTAPTQASAKPGGPGWLYADRQGQQLGPVSGDVLADLWRHGTVDDATLVWKEGMGEWQPLSSAQADLPIVRGSSEIARAGGGKKWLLAFMLLLMIGGGAAGGAYWFLFAGKTPGNLVPEAFRTGPSTISNPANETQIAGAVGLVVCGAKLVYPDGSEGEDVASTGTAFLISSDGYLLTNKHVVEQIANLRNARLLLKKLRDELLMELTPSVWVFFGKQKYPAEIIALSDNHDLAILKINRQHTPYFRLAGSDSLPRGRKVIACGFPGAAQQPLSPEEALRKFNRETLTKLPKTKIETHFSARDFEYITTEGTVSRVTTEDGGTRRWIQHTASVNAGNSGGPLLDENGLVVGINTLSFVKAYPGVSGVFFSLASPQMKEEITKHVPAALWEN